MFQFVDDILGYREKEAIAMKEEMKKELSSKKPRVLFVCNFNSTRSPAFEKYFKPSTKAIVRSAGLESGNPLKVDKEVINWATVIYPMTLGMKREIINIDPTCTNKVKVVGVGNEDFMGDIELTDLIRLFSLEKTEFW
jgi:predicted protein tyrosine phosphatase